MQQFQRVLVRVYHVAYWYCLISTLPARLCGIGGWRISVARQPRRHADELRPGARRGAQSVGIERLYLHGSIPPLAHDLRQLLGVVPVGLVYLHLERGAGVPRIKTDDVEPSVAYLMHGPSVIGPAS